MKLAGREVEFYVPDGSAEEQALMRTTHMGIGTHQDDLEIMAFQGILDCFQSADKWFLGVTVTDGAGSARTGSYSSTTNEQMMAIRRDEAKKAAHIGDYSGLVFLNHPSSAVKNPANAQVVAELKEILLRARPKTVYLHNLADKHDTHVASALRTIAALRELPADARPEKVLGCEVWKDLDWMVDTDKVVMDVSAHENLAMSLVGVFDSQVVGGKRYDLATMGRRRANATYFASHDTDTATSLIYAMDLTPLVRDPKLDPAEYVMGYIKRFEEEVRKRISAGLGGR